MDNVAVANRYRKQAEARLEMAGLLLTSDPRVQFDDRGDRHVTRANMGMFIWSAAIDLASVLSIQETRTQPNGRSPLISRFVTRDLPNTKPGFPFANLWQFIVKLHTAQHTIDTDPIQFGQGCIDSSLIFEPLNWLIEPEHRIPLRSYGWLRRIRTQYVVVRDDPAETVANSASLREIAVVPQTGVPAQPIHWAAQNPNPKAITVFLDNGADTDTRDDAMATPLHWAAASGWLQVIDVLIAKQADLEARDLNGATPLHHAAGSNSADAVMSLITHGADVNATDLSGETPLHQATIWQQDPMVTEILLQHGADPTISNLSSETPLSIARQYNPILYDIMSRV